MFYLIKWIGIFAALLSLASCSMLSKVGAPPKADLCMIQVMPHKTVKDALAVDLRCKNQKGTKFTIPIKNADKYVCLAPNQFVDVFTYVGKVVEALKIDVLK